MPHRDVSPARSETEFDITGNILGGAADDEDFPPEPATKRSKNDHAKGLEDGGFSDDDLFISAQQAAVNRKNATADKSKKKMGAFQQMGLSPELLKSILKKGYTVPTPVQRKAIPLVMQGHDLACMARTGAGKTASFVIPILEKLKAHSAKVGARAVILACSRELALQTLKVVKELGKGSNLRTVLLVGGDSLEEQFSAMTANPDIVIGTPGRFLHLKVEMSLDLSSVQHFVVDEADRLFEMGFAPQLNEILLALPPSRQTMLFSATMPKSLAEFARAGLQDPKLVRLDVESKLSSDLQSAFFTVKSTEKEGALLHILQDIIQMPTGAADATSQGDAKKRKRAPDRSSHKDSPRSTIVFTATKHHVEYVSSLLQAAGYAVSYVYGSLDQTARKQMVQDFRSRLTNILVVTDVAARGIDIPILANVVQYDFPSQSKLFVHRVGRTARAGSKGWSYSLVQDADMPYLLDLQLFLGKRLMYGRQRAIADNSNCTEDLVLGGLRRSHMERSIEAVNSLLLDDNLASLRVVAAKGEKMYVRSKSSASAASAKKAREILQNGSASELHILFNDDTDNTEAEKDKMLKAISGFRPAETVFEVGSKHTAMADFMRQRREQLTVRRQPKIDTIDDAIGDRQPGNTAAIDDSANDLDLDAGAAEVDMNAASEDDLEVTFSHPDNSKGRAGNRSWHDSDNFMSYAPRSSTLAEEGGYRVNADAQDSLNQSASFAEAARDITMDLTNDESKGFAEASKTRGMRWDKKSKRYVARANDEDGSKKVKLVRGESGQLIDAGFRSGRYDAWRKSNKIDRMPRIGETEVASRFANSQNGRRYKHKAERAPKEADRFRDNYQIQKKRVEEARGKRVGKFRLGNAKNELRGVEDVRKQRQLKERRKARSTRPSKKRKP